MQYKVETPIKFNGVHVEEGKIIEMSDAEAAPLLEIKAVTAVDIPFAGKISTPWGKL